MVILKVNNDLFNGLVGRALANVVKKKLGLSSDIRPKDISVIMEGDITRIHVNADFDIPTSQVEQLIKRNIF